MKSGGGAPYPATDNTKYSLISSVRPALALANLLLCYNFLTRTGHHSSAAEAGPHVPRLSVANGLGWLGKQG